MNSGQTPRTVARRLVADIAARAPSMLVHAGIDLGPAIEQALFGRLRRPRRASRAPGLRSLLRSAVHGVVALRPTDDPDPGDVVALVVNPAHARIFEPVRGELAARGIRAFRVFESHARGAAAGQSHASRLVDRLTPMRTAALLAFDAGARIRMADATRGFEEIVDVATAARMRAALAEAIGRAALYATCLAELAEHRPSLLIGFNEIGRSSRLLPAVGRRAGIPTLDIAHAEAVDVEAIEGAAYDRYAVFGDRASAVLAAAGIDPARIVPVGAPRFDALISRHREPPVQPAARRVVFASQWLGGRMTEEVKRATVAGAVAAAAAVAPCELVLQRHPIERDDIAARVAASLAPADVRVRSGDPSDLYAELDGAWLLVTGWSNAAFEGVLSNVPVLCINATGGAPPMPFAAEGIALGADDAETAARAAASLLDAPAWTDAVRRARSSLGEHLGPLDGRATDRLADLIASIRG
jgi:hypothetical protein